MLMMNVQDVARELRVSARHVWALLAKGAMPAPLRAGRAVRWRRSDIEAWVTAGMPDKATFEAQRGQAVGHA
jgi:excisionase family DNA binding protein